MLGSVLATDAAGSLEGLPSALYSPIVVVVLLLLFVMVVGKGSSPSGTCPVGTLSSWTVAIENNDDDRRFRSAPSKEWSEQIRRFI